MNIKTHPRAKDHKHTRLSATIFTALCGVLVVLGSFLPWISASGSRPMLGTGHTSLSQMLVYTFVNSQSFIKSVGLAAFVLGILIIGALFGMRTVVALAANLTIAAGGMWIGLVVHHFNTPELPNLRYVNPFNLPWSALRLGAWMSLIGAILGFFGAFLSRQRSKENGVKSSRPIS